MKSATRSKPKSKPRILARQPAGNRSLVLTEAVMEIEPPPEPGWPDRDDPADSPDRDAECSGCALLTARVAALQVEVETLIGTQRNHHELIANLNVRMASTEWGQIKEAQGSARRRRVRLAVDGAITAEKQN